jgi:endonuclease/exonuclease/phosphatase family metal-dependent hydrolase
VVSVRLATFNLESLGAEPAGAPTLKETLDTLRPQIVGLEADILCLQEVNAQRPPGGGDRRLLALEQLLTGTPYETYHLAATRGTSGRGLADVHNLVTLSRWPIATSTSYWHDLVSPPRYRAATAHPADRAPLEIRWDRPFLHCQVDHPVGTSIHVVNLHLRAPLAAPVAGQKSSASTWRSVGGWAEGFYIAGLKRSGQALEARLLVEKLFDRNGGALIAICGDCNAGLRETPLMILQGEIEDMNHADLAARRLTPVERNIAPARRYSLLHGGKKLMLDHILISQGLLKCLERVDLQNRGLPDEVEISEADPVSRHAALVAQFDMAQAGSCG